MKLILIEQVPSAQNKVLLYQVCLTANENAASDEIVTETQMTNIPLDVWVAWVTCYKRYPNPDKIEIKCKDNKLRERLEAYFSCLYNSSDEFEIIYI